MDYFDRPHALHLPRFKRPPGWSALNANAVRSRAALAFIAFENPHVAACAGTADHVMPQSWDNGTDSQVIKGYVVGRDEHMAPLSGVDSRVSNITAHAKSGSTRQYRLLPFALLLGGVVLAPWLIWAPILGGISFGIFVVQTGLVQRWLMPAPLTARSIGSIPASENQDSKIESRRSTSGSGWLLMAVLMLFGIQVLMLLATLNIKNREALWFPMASKATQHEHLELRKRPHLTAPTSLSERDELQDLYYDVIDDALESTPSQGEYPQ